MEDGMATGFRATLSVRSRKSQRDDCAIYEETSGKNSTRRRLNGCSVTCCLS
ncbi:hypothetical protein KCP78_21280 [Salmonella enterica subsp. enterica]|nr:hypothetical protein KCP78_21280 [Salmonella enterica subsp. enterica]